MAGRDFEREIRDAARQARASRDSLQNQRARAEELAQQEVARAALAEEERIRIYIKEADERRAKVAEIAQRDQVPELLEITRRAIWPSSARVRVLKQSADYLSGITK